jgi:hypothetical protein
VATFNTTNHLRIANENIVTYSSTTLLDKLQATPFHVLGLQIPAVKWGKNGWGEAERCERIVLKMQSVSLQKLEAGGLKAELWLVPREPS